MSNHYSIGEAAEAAGISTETLRIWERRYGRPVPERRASGHRRYTDDQVDWLRQVAKVVSKGMRPGRVMKLSDAELESLCDDRPPVPPVAPEVGQLMSAARDLDGQRFIRELDRAYGSRPVTRFAEEIVAPLTDGLGRGLDEGVVGAHQVAYVSGILEDYLHAQCVRYVVDPSAPRVLLASLCSEKSRALMLMASLLCAVEGVGHSVFAGSGDPASIGAAVRSARADVVAVCVAAGDPEGALATIEALRLALPDHATLVVAGEGAGDIERWPHGIEPIQGFQHWRAWLRQRRLSRQLAVG